MFFILRPWLYSEETGPILSALAKQLNNLQQSKGEISCASDTENFIQLFEQEKTYSNWASTGRVARAFKVSCRAHVRMYVVIRWGIFGFDDCEECGDFW